MKDYDNFYEAVERERIPEKEKQYRQELRIGISFDSNKSLTPGQKLFRRSYLKHAEDLEKSRARIKRIRSGKF